MTEADLMTHSVPTTANNATYCQQMPTDQVSWWTPGATGCRDRFHHQLASQAQYMLHEDQYNRLHLLLQFLDMFDGSMSLSNEL